MRTLFLILCFMLLPEMTRAQLRVVSDEKPLVVFAGEKRGLQITFQNPADKAVVADVHTRLHQTSSATTIPIAEAPWKKLQVLAGQTIIESATLDFPSVKAETRFLVQWVESTNKVIGTTEVLVYPPDLLKELKPLIGEDDGALGLFDPLNQLKLLVKAVKVDFVDLEDAGVEGFRGKLAIIGPFQSKTQMREGLATQIQTLARKGVAVVWIQPPLEPSPRPSPIRWEREKLEPSFYTVPEASSSVVVVQADQVSKLSESPRDQLNLIQLARLALHPEPVRLPYLTPQP